MVTTLKQWTYNHFFRIAVILMLSGCAAHLAPPYDKNVAESLNTATIETMTLLATTSQGTDKSTFSAREEMYNALIGRFDALALSAGARPMPKNKVTEEINLLLIQRGVKPLDDDDSTPPNSHAIEQIAKTLTKMRDTDKKQGITAYESQSFKNQVAIYFDQAITYENFLQR